MKIFEEKSCCLFKHGTETWLSSAETAAGEAVQSAYDPNSYGIVLGIIDASTLLVVWSREPSATAATTARMATEIRESIDADIMTALEALSPDEAAT